MRATIDGGGCVVVPKPVRERMGLRSGSVVEIVERDGWLGIPPPPRP